MFWTIFALSSLSFFAWSVAYVSCIRQAKRDKMCAMPAVPLALNLAWELVYLVVAVPQHLWLVVTNNVIWLLLDVAILATYFKYGRAEWTRWAPERLFIPSVCLFLAMALVVQLALLQGLPDAQLDYSVFRALVIPQLGCWYSAIFQNLLMSASFITMLLRRGGLCGAGAPGQNRTIAISKFIGTLAPTISAGVLLGNRIVFVIGLCCAVLDLLYIALVIRAQNESGQTAECD